MSARPLIAIDIDDVVSDSLEATRAWANARAGLDLQPEHYSVEEDYWHYYNRIWLTHGAGDVLNYNDFLDGMVEDQAHIPLLAGAEYAIKQLSNQYDIVFLTARPSYLETSTRQWLTQVFGPDVPVYFSNNPFNETAGKTKGEMCKELGAWLLIDDNADNCRSVLEQGLEAMLFGTYGWQRDIPQGVTKCADWPEVVEYLSVSE